jgi:hypothetical protein
VGLCEFAYDLAIFDKVLYLANLVLISINSIAYCGGIFGPNVGDDAIYYANCNLFSDFQLVPGRYSEDSSVTLIGGGTILPRAIKPEWIHYDGQPREYNYCMGVGVRDPEYWNQPQGKFDLRHWFGKKDIQLQKIIRINKGLKYAFRTASDILGDEVIIDREYCLPGDFERIKEFGFNRIGVRGPVSKRILADYGIESTVIGDPALHLEPSDYSYERNRRIIVALRRPGSDKRSKDTKYIDSIIEFCNSIDESEVLFIPFKPEDIPINVYAAKHVSNSDLYVTHHRQFDNILNIINNSDVMVGERLHASILAAACFTPFISLEYRTKNLDFARSVQMKENNIRTDLLTTDKLLDMYYKIDGDWEREVSDLKEEVTQKRDKLEQFAEMIKQEVL